MTKTSNLKLILNWYIYAHVSKNKIGSILQYMQLCLDVKTLFTCTVPIYVIKIVNKL